MPSIDAVIIPGGYCKASSPYWEMAQLATEFAPLLGVKLLHKRSLSDGREFLPKTLDDTLLFPLGHPLEGQPRYTWTERDARDGVLYGILIEAKHAETE
jgi:hypothetical protein